MCMLAKERKSIISASLACLVCIGFFLPEIAVYLFVVKAKRKANKQKILKEQQDERS